MKTNLILLITLFLSIQIYSQNIYVDSASTCNLTCNGSSWSNAYISVQDALEMIHSGDTIFIAQGTYFPDEGDSVLNDSRAESFIIGDSIVILGGYPSGGGIRNWKQYKTILSGEIQQDSLQTNNSYHVVYTRNISLETIVDGFYISNGCANGTNFSSYGGGWYNNGYQANNYANPTIRNCIFNNNYSLVDGSALFNLGAYSGLSSPLIINCTFTNNTGSPTVYNNSFQSGDSSPEFINCSFINNGENIKGGAVHSYTDYSICNAKFTNCTFANTRALSYGGLIYNEGEECTLEFTNCIIWSNPDQEFTNDIENDDGLTIYKNCIIKSSGGSINWDTDLGVDGGGNMDVDPLYVDIANGDIRIKKCSPAIDAGSNSYIPSSLLLDAFDNPRVFNNGTVDIGAHEYSYNSSPHRSVVDSISIIQNTSCSQYGVAQVYYSSTSGSSSVYWDNNETTDIADSLYSSHMVWVTNSISGCKDSIQVHIPVTRTGNLIYVDSAANGNNTGCNWTNAYNHLQDALAQAQSGDTILVSEGTYYPDQTIAFDNTNRESLFNIPSNVVLLGGYSPANGITSVSSRNWMTYKTVLSGDIQQDGNNINNSFRIVLIKDCGPMTTLDGFTITKGYADFFSRISSKEKRRGAGLCNFSTANNGSSPTIINCTFSDNYSVYGSAVYISVSHDTYTKMNIINSQFLFNNARNRAGALFITSSCDDYYAHNEIAISNCSFYQNTSDNYDGEAIYFSDIHNGGYLNLNIRNSIFWDDQTVTKAVISSSYRARIFKYNNLISAADPLFVNASMGNLRLKANSPAIDSGNNLYSTATTDMDNNQRIYGNSVDIGCFEYGASTYSDQKNIIDFSHPSQAKPAIIDNTNHTICLYIHPDSSVINLNPSFTISNKAKALIGNNIQSSGNSFVDFSSPVTYNIIAEDSSYQNWRVSVLNLNYKQSYNLCNPDSVFIGGTHITNSGIYYDSLFSSNGCDSIIIIDLTIRNVDTAVIRTNTTLTARTDYLTYQWIDCNNAMSPINGATNRSYTPNVNGTYAVIINRQNCIDTSVCYTISSVGIENDNYVNPINIFPNPTTGIINITLGNNYDQVRVSVKNILGQLIFEKHYTRIDEVELNIEDKDAGLYMVEISTESHNNIKFKIIKE